MNQQEYELQMRHILATQVKAELNDLHTQVDDLHAETHDIAMKGDLNDLYAHILKCVNTLLASVNQIAESMNDTMDLIDEVKKTEEGEE